MAKLKERMMIPLEDMKENELYKYGAFSKVPSFRTKKHLLAHFDENTVAVFIKWGSTGCYKLVAKYKRVK